MLTRATLTTVLAVAASALVTQVPAHAAPAVKKCGAGGTTRNGLYAVNVRARSVTCSSAREVSRKVRFSGRRGGTARTTVAKRHWRCTTVAVATGSEGANTRTKVDCRGYGSRLVRFELQS